MRESAGTAGLRKATKAGGHEGHLPIESRLEHCDANAVHRFSRVNEQEAFNPGRPQSSECPRPFLPNWRIRLSGKVDGSAALMEVLLMSGYTEIRCVNDQWCALKQFNYTTAVVVGLDDVGYQLRYCYEHWADAQAALLAWDGQQHPSGPWIKCKGGGIDLLNPEVF